MIKNYSIAIILFISLIGCLSAQSMMGPGMMGRGMMGSGGGGWRGDNQKTLSADMPINPEQALEIAQRFLDYQLPGVKEQ